MRFNSALQAISKSVLWIVFNETDVIAKRSIMNTWANRKYKKLKNGNNKIENVLNPIFVHV